MFANPHAIQSAVRRLAVGAVFALAVGAMGASPARAQTATRTATPIPTVTATPTPLLVRVQVSPRAVERKVGQFQQFSAFGIFSDGSSKNFTQRVTYFSSNLSVVYPPNEVGNKGKVEAVGIGTATISIVDPDTGIGSEASGESAIMTVVEAPTPTPTRTGPTPTRTRSPTPTATATPVLQQLLISPLIAKRKVGETQNFSVHAIYSDGTDKNVTQLATYSSSNTNVVTCPNDTTTNKGQTFAVGPGVAIIKAVWNGVSTTNTGGDAEFTVTISPTPTATRTGPTPTPTLSPTPTATSTPVIVSLKLTPETQKRGIGTSQTYVATATLSDGSTKNITQRCTYTSSNPAVAQTGTDPNSKSKVLAVGEGKATISAVDDTTKIGTTASGGDAVLEVFLAPTPTPTNTGVTPTRTKTPTPTPTATPKLVSLAIAPTNVKKAAGQFQSFTVTGTYSNGDVKSMTQKVDYISSNQNIVQTGVDPLSKSKTLAKSPGTAVITAKDPATGVTIPLDEGATFVVTEAPTPTPTRTGPTSTGPTGTPTESPSPTPSPTPVITKLVLKPLKAQKPIGTPQFFTVTGTFSDGVERNVTQKVTYTSSDPTIASAPNEDGNRGKVLPLKIGKVTISATDPSTGVTTTASNSDAEFTVVEGSGSPNPRVTATPSPDQVGNATTACQRDVRRAARAFLDKKMKTLEKCGSAASNCVQRKPGDAGCLPGVRTRCATALGKIAEDETKLIAAVIRKCAGLSATDVLGEDGLAYGEIANSCAVRFGRALSDLTSVAQCLSAQHACRAETLFALERPRAGELLRLVDATPDAGQCREDFGGDGAGVGDPKGLGKTLEGCVKALVHGGTSLARVRLASIGRCIDGVFLCVEAAPGNAACLTKATAKCEREFGKVQREVGKLTVTAGKRCNGIDFGVLSSAEGAHLDAVSSQCPSYGIPSVTSLSDYVACLVRQHECEVAELVRFESPRAGDILELVGRTLVDGTCPTP
jgi:hypothetical protein